MQIVTTAVIGLMVWDKQDRVTAAKRYREAIDLAKTPEIFNCLGDSYGEAPKAGAQGLKHFNLWVAVNVKQAKDNLKVLAHVDTMASAFADPGSTPTGNLRKEQLPCRYMRSEADGTCTTAENHVVATDRCANCGKSDVMLSRCSKCMKVAYCGIDCQKADWKYAFCPLSSHVG